MTLGSMIFQLVYNIYDFDRDLTTIFYGNMLVCRYCKYHLHRLQDRPHYVMCECGKRHMFRKRRKR